MKVIDNYIIIIKKNHIRNMKSLLKKLNIIMLILKTFLKLH